MLDQQLRLHNIIGISVHENYNTVIIMISLRYRYVGPIKHRYLTVTLPLLTLMTVTDRYSPLPLLTVTVTHRFFWKFNILFISVLKVAGF